MANNVKNEVLIRVYIVLGMLVLFAAAIFYKAILTGVVEGEKWRSKGKNQRVKYVPVDAERGNIMANDGSMLATSLPFFEIRFDPNSTGMREEDFFENLDTLAYCLAMYVDNSYTIGGMREELLQRRQAGERNMLIKKEASYTELQQIQSFPLFKKGQYKGGLIVKKFADRDNPFGLLADRTIGYVRENAKPVGLEGYYNEVLTGQQGKRLMYRARDTWIPVNDLTEIEPKTGDDLVTTLDIGLQEITEAALYRSLNHHQAKSGCAIVMEVETGAIRAIANLGRTSDDSLWETYNYAIGSAVEPGSTYKLATMMSLMEDGLNLFDTIDLEQGQAEFYEEVMLDASYHQLDSTTVKRAFEISSNVGMGKLVAKYYGDGKAQQFIDRLKQFHLHVPSGIEIEGEGVPYVKTAYSKEDDWSGTTLPWMSIGYEVTTTPLQLLTFYNAVANDGRMMKPYLVEEIQHFGETLQEFKPTVVKRQIASKETIRKAQLLLHEVVENGTAKKMKTNKYSFAGKTGTAQINYRKFIRRTDLKYRASFAGYFPADDPKYSCIVMVTDPKVNGIYGSEVALPVFREIADNCFATKIELQKALNATPKPLLTGKELPSYNVGKTEDLAQVLDYLNMPHSTDTSAQYAVLLADEDQLRLRGRNLDEKYVPNVVGMGLKDALYILENQHLNVVVSGVGKVVRQSIKPGTKVRGQTIKLTMR